MRKENLTMLKDKTFISHQVWRLWEGINDCSWVGGEIFRWT